MAASAFLVTVPDTAHHTRYNGKNAVVCWAEDATAAKEVAKSYFDGDAAAAWTAATATAIVAPAAEFEDWTFSVTVYGATVKETFTVVGDATTDTLDEIGAALVLLLNDNDDIANAAYVSGTDTLTVAEGSAADDLGDHSVFVTITPPSGYSGIPSLVSTITHKGDATDDLTVVFSGDATPHVYAAVQA